MNRVYGRARVTALTLAALLVFGGAWAVSLGAGATSAKSPVGPAVTKELAARGDNAPLGGAAQAGADETQPAQLKIGPPRKPPLIRPVWPRVALEILVDGRPLPTIRYEGRTYLPVPRLGLEYEIRVSNHGPRRLAALVSVDGLSIINGQPASDASPGYVVAAQGQIRIKGWRRDLETVAAFRFVEREKSYAALMGHPEKVGTITLLGIEEQVVWTRDALERGATAAKQAYGKGGNVGTEYGREIASGAYYVPFLRSANRWTVTLHYDTPEALRAAGVPFDLLPPVPAPINPEFAPPPPGYKGK
jgi:hypothetical protein